MNRRTWTPRRLPRARLATSDRSRGQSLVELALVTPILLLLLLAAIDLGRVFYVKIAVANSAREGAIMAAQDPSSWSSGAACSSSNKVMCAALRESTGSWVTITPSDVTLICHGACSSTYGNRAKVTVTGHFSLLTPLLSGFTGGQNITLQESAEADILAYPAGAGFPTPAPTPTPTPAPTPTPTGPPAPTPSPTPTPTPMPTCAPPSVNFTTSQQNKNAAVVFTSGSAPTTGSCAISYYRWDFGDGTTSAGSLPSASHDYGKANEGVTFNVTLTVTTPGGTYSITLPVTTRS